MITFSYQDYVLRETEIELVTLVPGRINSAAIIGTQYFYKEGRFIKAVDVTMMIENDSDRNENFVLYGDKRIYAAEYFNPEIKTFVSL